MPTSPVLSVLARLAAAVVVVVATAALLAMPLVPVVLVGTSTVEAVETTLLDAPPLPDELPVAAQLSTVHDRDGARIAELAGEIRREPVAYEDIPQLVIDAVLATEDSGFFEHAGVEHESMLRAAGRNLAAGGIAEGASTITQQYVKMTLLSPEQTIERKIHEVLLAVELEKRDSKEQILEGYLNAVYLGEGVYGFGTAADHYFSRSLDELDVADVALLAGTIRAPAVIERGRRPGGRPRAPRRRHPPDARAGADHPCPGRRGARPRDRAGHPQPRTSANRSGSTRSNA